MNSSSRGSTQESVLSFPLLALRDVVVYPQMVMPLFVGRTSSIAALDAAMQTNSKQIFLATQRDPMTEQPQAKDVYQVGCVANVLQMLKLPDGTVKVLVEGQYRACLRETNVEVSDDHLQVVVDEMYTEGVSEREAEVLSRSLIGQFEQYVKLNGKVAPDIIAAVSAIEEPSRLVDTIAAHLTLNVEGKQKILAEGRLRTRIDVLFEHIESEIDLFLVGRRIRGRVKQQMEKTQREYYLNEQMKAIQKELGQLDVEGNDLDALETKIRKGGLSTEAQKKALAELAKLKQMSPMSAEATVVRSYVDWLVQLPWKKKSKVSINLPAAEKLLNAEHFGLTEVKDRILEYLAVQARVKKMKGPVLCLVGPPGVGKTSLGRSIAKAINREFARIALGGVRDEAEIRGHRRTYIGSMPGKIVQKMVKVGVRNPLVLLDEIDKMAADMRGDPASALLEVLDPEQNNQFSDHYLEVDYDLSDVMFVCTANSMNIPAPLLDRMEIIRIPGYTEDEKINIAQQYLIPKQFEANGLNSSELELTEPALRDLIRYYTREAGVRSLEREIAKVARKVVKQVLLADQPQAEALDKTAEQSAQAAVPKTIQSKRKTSQNRPTSQEKIIVDRNQLNQFAGVRRFHYGQAEQHDRVGQVTGLAWTSAGGDLLVIEAVAIAGKGKSIQTGSLGEVMQESIRAALTVVRSRVEQLGIDPEFYEKTDLHIHVPEGATPKDGPSAGIGMCTALVSVLTNIPVRADVAMTGEITLRGQVLPIGGLKEKLLAAHRGGIKTVVIPKENERDLAEVPDNVKAALTIHCAEWIDEVLGVALSALPQPTNVVKTSTVPKTGKTKASSDERPAH